MVLQRIEGVSDREAVDRFAFDLRWKYASEANTKVQPPSAREGKISQDDFRIDLDASTVQCPAGQLVTLRLSKDGSGEAVFGALCNDCPRRAERTESKSGRAIRVHRKHRTLDGARKLQRDANWKERYGSTRPKVERKFAHLMRRKHGGRRARMRGQLRIAHDLAAVNLARLSVLEQPPIDCSEARKSRSTGDGSFEPRHAHSCRQALGHFDTGNRRLP
jgi:hypothetical protein